MNGTIKEINVLLVEIFNDIMSIERETIKNSKFSDLSVTEMHVLEAIGLKSRTMTDVAGDIGVTVGTLTTSMNRLVKKGYVERTRSEEDRRYVKVSLTQKGKLAYRVHEAFHEKMVRTMIDKLSDDDNEVLIQALTQLNQFFIQNYRAKIKNK